MTLPSVRANVRQAIVSYLQGKIVAGVQPQNQTIPYLANVYGFPMKVTNEDELYLEDGVGNGAAIWLYFPESVDHLVELPGNYKTSGRTGKAVEITCTLICIFRSQEPTSQAVGLAAESFVDGLCNAIREDPNAGNPSVIFQWGLGSFPNGGPDLRTTQLMPRPVKGRAAVTDVESHVEVTVVSFIDS